MANGFRFFDPMLAALIPEQGRTTLDENRQQRLESLLRASRGASPMRADLYDAVYGTGPTLGQLQSDPKDFRTSLLSTRSVAQDASALDALDKAAGRQGVAIADTERINKPIVGSERTYDPNRLPKAGAMFTVGRDVDIVGSAPKRPSVAPDERDLPADIDMGSGPTEDTDIEDLAPPERTLLERLGLAIRNNPELAAMGAQLAGGLISNAAQNRAQRQADRTNQQRTARSNLISALTGGRVRPNVERAQADTGGILSLNTLGQAIRGGGAVVQGELARRVEEDERKRRADLEERQVSVAEQQADTRESARIDEKSYRERIAELQEMGVAFDLYKLMNSGEKKETPPQKVRDQYAAASRIIRQVDNVERLLEDTGFFQSGSSLKLLQLAGLDEGLPQFMGGDKTRELKAAINTLVQTLGEGLSGVLSDRDIEFLRQQAIKETDSLDTAMLKAQQIRNRMASTITENYNIDSQYFNMAPFESIVEKVGAAGEQGFGAFVQDLANAKINVD